MIGVLALQGAFQKHAECLRHIGHNPILVKTVQQLDQCSAIVLPGGESTAHHKLMNSEFWNALKTFCSNKPALGTCCGLILLSNGVRDDTMKTMGALDVTVDRNAYGPQLESFQTQVELALGPIRTSIHGCFIRAPKIVEVGADVKILAKHEGQPVIVQQGQTIGCSFHPELLLDTQLHEYFIDQAKLLV